MQTLEPDVVPALRTIQRDVIALEDAGFQIYSEMRGKQVVWFLDGRTSLPMPLDAHELMALHSANITAQQQQLPGAAALRSLCGKMFAGLTDKKRDFLQQAEAAILITGPRNIHPALSPRYIDEQVGDAIINHKTTEIVYQALNTGEVRRRLVDPYAIITAHPNLYIWGFCHERRGMRTFHISRIRDLRATDQTFVPAGTSPQAAFEASFEIWQGEPEQVRIRFTGKAAVLVSEHQWHPSQTLTVRPLGVELTMHVHPGVDLQKWILSFGAQAQVLEPASLRNLVSEQCLLAASLYRTPPAKKPSRPVERAAGGRSYARKNVER
ncbi:MAG TPA: WYL domain-containing protein [Acidobacteriota bacterium]